MRSKAGGGINSKNVRNVSQRGGAPHANIISPASANQIGESVAFRKDNLPMGTMAKVPLGNALANNVGKGGPGAGRTVYRSGSQQGLKPATPMRAGRGILNNE